MTARTGGSRAKYGGLSAAQQTMRLSAASVEMTIVLGDWKKLRVGQAEAMSIMR
jgi:hypothetical protein